MRICGISGCSDEGGGIVKRSECSRQTNSLSRQGSIVHLSTYMCTTHSVNPFERKHLMSTSTTREQATILNLSTFR